MKIAWIGILSLAGAALAGCVAANDAQTAGRIAGAGAEIRTAGGELVARAEAREADSGVTIRIAAAGLAPGTYGAHVHMVGRCDPPGFESAGAHWNPTDRQHGIENPQGQHLGDLPNLRVTADGGGTLEFTIDRTSLRDGELPMLDSDGAAVVIHADPDDYRTDPTGNSGARIACGVLG